MKKKVLLIGSGGREHAIAWKLSQSPLLEKLYIAPGNPGTEAFGENVHIAVSDVEGLLDFAKKAQVDLVVVGPDDPLALGIVDIFQREKIAIFGPTQAASRLESSKVFAKEFMIRHDIPTARYAKFYDFEEAVAYADNESLPLVIKASGLAKGKGVIIAHTKQDVITALREIMVEKIFGNSGNEVIIEEFLDGFEISIHVFSDGRTWRIFPASQNQKRAHEEDEGVNTAGMGSFAPVPFVSLDVLKEIDQKIVGPTLQGMMNEGCPFVGVLFPNIMMTRNGLKVLEYNVRFGEPETETYMRLLETDILEIFDACVSENLSVLDVHWKHLSACNIILASSGYPGAFDKGIEIDGISEAEQISGVTVFQSGTYFKDKQLYTNSGRVLGVSAVGATLPDALRNAYEAISKIHFSGMQYRKDIGKKALLVIHNF